MDNPCVFRADLMSRTKWDWEVVSRRFRERRKLFNWSVDEVASRAGVSRDTVMRVEKGKPCSDKSLHALRSVYALFSAQLVTHEELSPHFSSCKAEDVRWMAANNRDHKGRLVKDIDYSFVDSGDERRRRAGLGYQKFFTGFIRSELQGGTMASGIMEIYQPSWIDQHYGEEYVYCLSGEALMTVEGDECHLKPGDSMVFDATKKHSYAPAPNSELPAVILFVVAARPDEADRVKQAIAPREKWGV